MKYIKQLLIILLFTMLGELLAYVLPLPIPAVPRSKFRYMGLETRPTSAVPT